MARILRRVMIISLFFATTKKLAFIIITMKVKEAIRVAVSVSFILRARRKQRIFSSNLNHFLNDSISTRGCYCKPKLAESPLTLDDIY